MNQGNEAHHRTIRSFVRREGRLTTGQQRALETLLPQYGIPDEPTLIDPVALFGNMQPVVLEIGFGNGHSLVEMARNEPDHNYIGIEVYRPGIGNCLLQIEKTGIQNLRVMEGDAVEILRNRILDHSLDRVQIFFPDPWHKKKHHKRRIIQPAFARLLQDKLRKNAIIHLATDWEAYAEHMLEVMEAESALTNLAGAGQFSPRPEIRPLTKFEHRGQRKGHGVWDLLYRYSGA